MSQRRKLPTKSKSKDTDQFAVVQPTAVDVLDQLRTRRHTYSRTPQVTKPRKSKKRTEDEGDSSVPASPYRTTSTEAVDTEEGQEITQYIKQKAYQRQQKGTSGSKTKIEGTIYDVPRPVSIPVPEPKRDWSTNFERPSSERANTPTPLYEELGGSVAQTPRYFNRTQEALKLLKRHPSHPGQLPSLVTKNQS